MNCGDWVDSCTAIVEHFDGRMQLVRWIKPDMNTQAIAVPIAEVPLA